MKMIKSHDLFAHEVKFNLNDGNEAHPTTIGSLFSISIKLLIVYYIYHLLYPAFTHDSDSQSSYTDSLDLSKQKPVNLANSSFFLYHVLTDENDNAEDFMSDEFQNYLNISFYQGSSTGDDDTHRYIPIRKCTKEDFVNQAAGSQFSIEKTEKMFEEMWDSG